MIDFLQVGQKVTLEIIRENKSHYFSTKIEDLTQELILVGMPMKEGNTFPTYIDEKIYIFFSRKDSYYCLECVVKKRSYLPIPILFVKPIRPPYKDQKREYFRLKMSTKVLIRKLEGENWQKGYTVDISASGAKIALDFDMPNKSIINLKIPDIFGNKKIEAIVVRREKDTTNKVYPYNIGVSFKDLDEKLKDKVVKILLAKQRELRKKGII